MNAGHQRTGRVDQSLASRFEPLPLPIADAVSRDQHDRRIWQGSRLPCRLERREALGTEVSLHDFVVDELPEDRRARRVRNPADDRERVANSETHSQYI